MAIDVQCSSCTHEWTVPTAKGGLSVHCPECDADVEVPRPKRDSSESGEFERIRAGHRPHTDNNIMARGILLGGLLLLVGIGALITLRVTGLMGTENLNFDPEDAVARVTTDDGKTPDETVSGGGGPSDPTTNDDSTADNDDQSPADTALNDGGTAEALTPAQKRERILLSLESVAIDVEPLVADQRGAVVDTVEVAVEGALSRCRLEPADDATAVIHIQLKLQGDDDPRRVVMTATLKDGDGDDAFVLWERTSGVGLLTDRALSTGVVPARLEQDVGTFFAELRAMLVDLRLENAS